MGAVGESSETIDEPAAAEAGAETLVGGGGGGLAAGELVWAKPKGQPWWPALVVGACAFSPSGAHQKRPSASAAGAPPGLDVLVAYLGHGHGHGGEAARCRAAQLRGFVAAGVDEMARQSGAKGFVAAVEEALGHVGRCLEAELTCHCVPPEARSSAPPEGTIGIVNLAPSEFLHSIRDVALDLSTTDLIECARLKSWLTAFGRGWGKDGAGYYPRQAVDELVDRVDLDVLAGEVAGDETEGKEKGEHPRLQALEEKLHGGRKRRSMALLMGELDSVAARSEKSKEAGPGEEENVGVEDEKKCRSPGGKTGEESGFVKRERKKSKYLSPPYTDLNGPILQKTGDARTPRKSIDVFNDWGANLPEIQKCDGEGIHVEEDEEKALSVKFGAASVEEIIWMIRCTARDVFHTKWNRPSKVAKGFLAFYRSSMFVEGSNNENYKAHTCEAAKIAKEDMIVKFHAGKFGANVENVFGKAGTRTPGSVFDPSAVTERKKSGSKWNSKKDGDGGRQMGNQSGSVVKKKKKKTDVGTSPGPGLAFTSVVSIRQVKAEDIRSQKKVGGGAKSKGVEIREEEKNPSVSITPSPGSVVDPSAGSELKKSGLKRNNKTARDGSGSVGKGKKKKVDVGSSPGPGLAFTSAVSIRQVKADDIRSQKEVGGGAKSGGIEIREEEKNPSVSMTPEAGNNALMNMESVTLDVPASSEPLLMDGKKDDANGKAAERTDKESHDSQEAARLKIFQKIEVANGKKIIGMTSGFKDQSPKDKSKQKKKKTISALNAADIAGKTTNGTYPKLSNLVQKKKKKKKAGQHFGNPAALLLDFKQDVIVPSKEELLSTFGKFGFLIESESEIVQDTRSARVVFAKSAEAEAAYNSAETLGTFGPPSATLRLHYLPPIKLRSPPSPSRSPASKPPLTDIRKNLEKMISSLTVPSPFKKAASPDGPKPVADNLVGEMQGLLAKVDKMLSGPSTSTPP